MKDFLFKSIHWIYTTLICLVFLVVLIDNKSGLQGVNNMIVHNAFLILLLLVIGYFGLKWFENLTVLSERRIRRILYIATVVLFLIQIIIAHRIYFYTGWDAGAIRDAAFYFIEHPEQIRKYFNLYFSYHTNQTSITLIIGYIVRFLHQLDISNVYFGAIIFSALSVNLSGLLIHLIMLKRLKNKNIALVMFSIFSVLCLFSPWITIPYSDTYMMIFPVIALFAYMNLKSKVPLFVHWLLIFFVVFVGASIKPQALIIAISLIIFTVIEKIDKPIVKQIQPLLLVALSLFSANLLVNTIHESLLSKLDLKQEAHLKFTIPHYLMVGLNPVSYGIYVADDAQISYGQFTIEDRETRNWEEIRERIQVINQDGWIQFIFKKMTINFNDGTFAWGMEGNFVEKRFEKNDTFSSVLREYFEPDGSFNEGFKLIQQFMWLSILLLSCLFAFQRRHNNDKDLIELIVIGIILFNMIFEARSRYLFSFIPYFIILAGLGLDGYLIKKAHRSIVQDNTLISDTIE